MMKESKHGITYTQAGKRMGYSRQNAKLLPAFLEIQDKIYFFVVLFITNLTYKTMSGESLCGSLFFMLFKKFQTLHLFQTK